MAKVDFFSSIGHYPEICDYLVSLDPRLVLTGDGEITVDNTFKLQLGGSANTNFQIYVNGDYYSGVSIRCFEGYHLNTVFTDNIIYIKVFNQERTRSNCILFYKDGSNYYAGITGKDENYHEISIHDIQLMEEGSTVTGYIPKMINFTLPAGEIAYSQYAPFASAPSDGSVYSYIAELVSTSTLILDGVISMGNHNYYSIGTNTMIAIDQ